MPRAARARYQPFQTPTGAIAATESLRPGDNGLARADIDPEAPKRTWPPSPARIRAGPLRHTERASRSKKPTSVASTSNGTRPRPKEESFSEQSCRPALNPATVRPYDPRVPSIAPCP